MKKLSEVLKLGDKITIYNKRGSNWRVSVIEIDDANYRALLRVGEAKRGHAGMKQQAWWYEIKISAKGIPYAEG